MRCFIPLFFSFSLLLDFTLHEILIYSFVIIDGFCYEKDMHLCYNCILIFLMVICSIIIFIIINNLFVFAIYPKFCSPLLQTVLSSCKLHAYSWLYTNFPFLFSFNAEEEFIYTTIALISPVKLLSNR